jgi:hypothetical protein
MPSNVVRLVDNATTSKSFVRVNSIVKHGRQTAPINLLVSEKMNEATLLRKENQMEREIYYRFREELMFNSEMKIVADEFVVIKHTPKGCWVKSTRYEYGKKHFILDGKGKRFAYKDLEDAKYSFIRRKKQHIFKLECQLVLAKAALKGVEDPNFVLGCCFEDETLVAFTEY